MKETTREVLTELIQSMHGEGDISAIFDMYSIYEIVDIASLIDSDHREFYNLVKRNIGNLTELEQKTAQGMAHKRVYALELLKRASSKFTLTAYQQVFADEIKKIILNNKEVKILEVGSGRIPYSSILLGDEGYNISSMDNFYLPNECLSRLGVKGYRQLFHIKEDVSQYDFLVGRKPCSAIRAMVVAGKKYAKPYFIKLCNCSFGGGDVDEWKPILSKIDHNIDFYKGYAYNFNNASFDVAHNIEEIIEMDKEKES